MADHVRKSIVRDPIVARLKDRVAVVSGRVFANRGHGPASHEMQCLYVSTPGETPRQDAGPRRRPMQRDEIVNITAFASSVSETADDDLDEMFAQVEEALFDFKAVHPHLEALSYAGMQAVFIDGERQHGVAQIAFVATVTTAPGDPRAPYNNG